MANKVNPKEVEHKAVTVLTDTEKDKFYKMTFREKAKMVAKAGKLFNRFCPTCKAILIKDNGRIDILKYCENCADILRGQNGN